LPLAIPLRKEARAVGGLAFDQGEGGGGLSHRPNVSIAAVKLTFLARRLCTLVVFGKHGKKGHRSQPQRECHHDRHP
jgi:hypothetical protein